MNAEPEPMTFAEVVMECARNRDLLAEFDRLAGCDLSKLKSGLTQMIDEATGWEREQLGRFVGIRHGMRVAPDARQARGVLVIWLLLVLMAVLAQTAQTLAHRIWGKSR